MLKVFEIFKSIQGESTRAGLPCTFIRLSGCNLRCKFCDTQYAYEDGRDMTVEEIFEQVSELGCKLIEITGGEPLLQAESHSLAQKLLDQGYAVLIETNGSLDISAVDERAVLIMDVKCPGSGMSGSNRFENMDKLREHDEIKFVLSNRDDYDWAKGIISKYELEDRAAVLLSAVHGELSPALLAQWMTADNMRSRLQLQLHKYIWEPDRRGV